MLKVVYNSDYGGFGWTPAIADYIANWFKRRGLEFNPDERLPRHHPALVQAVEVFEGTRSAGDLKVAEIDADRYYITDYDGAEEVVSPDDQTEWIVVDEVERKRCHMD